ncbi:MAG: nucleotide exchange factor GrpE [Ignavibacteriales bacterium]|nr:nucleotide exchange factor GrpE [Ignavibacteriales bacterium]
MKNNKEQHSHTQQTETVIPDSKKNGDALVPESVDEKLKELETEIAKYKDQFLRKAAEFDNYKRRIEQERLNLVQYANEQLLLDILPIVDDIQRSLLAGKEHTNFDTFYSGVELISSKLSKLLEKRGVTTFPAVGEMFDVNLHDVLLSVPRSDIPDHTIVEEVQKGYMMHSKVLRHAKVIVAENSGTADSKGMNQNETQLANADTK